MISGAVGRIPVEWHFHMIYALLAGAAFIGGLGLALNFKTVTFTHTKTVKVGAVAALRGTSAAQVAAAWGAPDQSVPGSQLGLPAGITCYAWNAKQAVLCY